LVCRGIDGTSACPEYVALAWASCFDRALLTCTD
jgi:hypothetical protein